MTLEERIAYLEGRVRNLERHHVIFGPRELTTDELTEQAKKTAEIIVTAAKALGKETTMDEYYGARIAYEAYRKFSEGKSLVSGQEIPPFDDLPESIKKAWDAAAQAILNDLRD